MSNLLPHQIEANEAFFTSIIELTSNGGAYCWPAIQEIFTIKDGKLHGTDRGLRAAAAIVSEQFFTNHFAKI